MPSMSAHNSAECIMSIFDLKIVAKNVTTFNHKSARSMRWLQMSIISFDVV